MRVHSIAMPAASKKSPGRRRKRHGGSWIYHRNSKRSVIRKERERKGLNKEKREREKREGTVLLFLLYTWVKDFGIEY